MKPILRLNVKSMFFVMFAAAAMAFSACGDKTDETDNAGRVTGVSVNKSALTLAVGGSETLTATVTPEDADNKNVTWASDNDAVATVNSATGEVRAVSKGLAVITVTTEDGGKVDICTVTVGDAVSVTSVMLDKNELSLEPGDVETLTVTVAPGKATNKNVTWANSNEDAVSFDPETGLVTALVAGRATLTVTTVDGGLTDKCVITVAVPVTGIGLNKSALSLEFAGDEILEAAVEPADATVLTVNWTSSDPEIASVNYTTGHVTGLGAGTAVITATTKEGGFTKTCTVTVTDTYDANGPKYNNVNGIVANCADPYILEHNGTYYLYGTGGSGIRVHTSTNLVNWSTNQGATGGYALSPGDVSGTTGFWAPEVYLFDDTFYMFYTANEYLFVATATDPKGPFKTPATGQEQFHTSPNEIDSHVFVDDDGKKYIYFVRFNDGNCIWVAELNDDMQSMKENTLRQCIAVAGGWERVNDAYYGSRVAEGPFILKHNDYYYLTYSANHYQSKSYAVGYAYSTSPTGPWTKYENNPILIGDMENIAGTGHHSFFHSPSGALYIVYHSHYSPTTVQSRKACIDRAVFDNSTSPARIVIEATVTDTVVK